MSCITGGAEKNEFITYGKINCGHGPSAPMSFLKDTDILPMLCGYHLYRGSYMSAHVLLILLNEFRKRDKCEHPSFFATSLINSIIQEYEC